MMKRIFLGFTIAVLGMTLVMFDANYLFLGKMFNYFVPCDQSATSTVSCTQSYDAVLICIISLIAAGGLIYALINLLQLARTRRER